MIPEVTATRNFRPIHFSWLGVRFSLFSSGTADSCTPQHFPWVIIEKQEGSPWQSWDGISSAAGYFNHIWHWNLQRHQFQPVAGRPQKSLGDFAWPEGLAFNFKSQTRSTFETFDRGVPTLVWCRGLLTARGYQITGMQVFFFLSLRYV